jgi:hypothetical protein
MRRWDALVEGYLAQCRARGLADDTLKLLMQLRRASETVMPPNFAFQLMGWTAPWAVGCSRCLGSEGVSHDDQSGWS